MPTECDADLLTATPVVTIMVDSPKDTPNIEFCNEKQSPVTSTKRQSQSSVDQTFTFDVPADAASVVESIDDNQPIDVNEPRDTTNIYYDYHENNSEICENDPSNVELNVSVEPTISGTNDQMQSVSEGSDVGKDATESPRS